MFGKLFKKKNKHFKDVWNYDTMFGANVSFSVSEAYKFLRTNIMFSLADEGKCHVIGLTSSIQGEGKSTTTCNLAYALAETGKKILLLEADLRRPTIAAKLGMRKRLGISNILVEQMNYREIVQTCKDAPNMDVMVAGFIPPNPSELLASRRMEQLLDEMCKDYDYIIIDLPPVSAVTDALAIAKLLDGMVVVVRGGIVEQKALADTMRQLELVNVPILGFVYRDIEEGGLKYGKSYKHYKYYKYYRSKDDTSKSEKKKK